MTHTSLPKAFEHAMNRWLGPEWPELREALQMPPERGVRLHRVTTDTGVTDRPSPELPFYAVEGARLKAPTSLVRALGAPVPWQRDAFYIQLDSNLGKTVYHECGAFYLQEPSAMAVAAALDVRPGERVLDLCAAPGGKSTAIGRQLAGRGLFVANEIHPTRVVALAQNLERLGVPAYVLNESPDRIARAMPGFFDAILVDAPCSGEGMFRKDPDAMAAWSEDAPSLCNERQRDILAQAVRLVRSGGRIVYSTCTFNPIENEQLVAWALATLPLELVALPVWAGWETGRSDFAPHGEDMSMTRRLWPHKGRGEGHFIAKFRVQTDGSQSYPQPTMSKKIPAGWEAFLRDLVGDDVPLDWQIPIERSGTLYAGSALFEWTKQLKVLRAGVPLAVAAKNRFEPHHALAMAIHQDRPRRAASLTPEAASRYLAGESQPDDGRRGWLWMHVDGLPIGWGKSVPGRVNNAFPKGLRRPGALWQ